MGAGSTALGDLVQIVGGGTPSTKVARYYEGEIPWVTPKDMKTWVISDSVEHISEDAIAKSATKIVPAGAVLVVIRSGVLKHTLPVAITSRPVAINQDMKALICSEHVYPPYLGRYLVASQARLLSGVRATTADNLPLDLLKRLRVPLPPLPEQRRIAAILDKADAVRRKRQQTLDLADQFLRSAFLDMFGDPVTNPRGWQVRKLSDAFVTDRPPTKCGPFGSALRKKEYVEAGVPVLTMDNIVGDSFALEGCLFVPQEKWETLAQYEVQPGDIIISRAGTVGKMCVVPDLGVPAIISTNLIRLSLNPDVIEPAYFVTLMSYCRGRVGTLRTGADGAYSFMNTGILQRLRMPFPPAHAQRAWVLLRSSAEQCEATADRNRRELEALSASLVDRAFRGGLAKRESGVEVLTRLAGVRDGETPTL